MKLLKEKIFMIIITNNLYGATALIYKEVGGGFLPPCRHIFIKYKSKVR